MKEFTTTEAFGLIPEHPIEKITTKFSHGLTMQEIIVVSIVLGVPALILVIWLFVRSGTICPQCKKYWGKKVIDTILLESRVETRQTYAQDVIRNSKGEVTGTVTRPTTKLVTVKKFERVCQCVHCHYRWSYVTTSES